jgi:hypothetical protein
MNAQPGTPCYRDEDPEWQHFDTQAASVSLKMILANVFNIHTTHGAFVKQIFKCQTISGKEGEKMQLARYLLLPS